MSSARRLARRFVHRGQVIALSVDRVALPDGPTLELDLVTHPGAAAVVPVNAAGQVTLVRQLRYPTGTSLLEVPAGRRDGDEAPEACARRECEEETGLRPDRLTPLGAIWTTPGFCTERIWLYLGEALQPTAQALDPGEALTLEPMPLTAAVALALDGGISDAKSICALLRADALLRHRQAEAAPDAPPLPRTL